MARPLAFTVDIEDIFNEEGGTLNHWLVLKMNELEICRAESFYSADYGDAEQWAADVLTDIMKHARDA